MTCNFKKQQCCVMAIGSVLFVHSCLVKLDPLIGTEFVNNHTGITSV